jgi:hypothetical protein
MDAGMLRSRAHKREWFADSRDGVRQLQVTCHDDVGRVVFSIWHGDTCAATFRLPVQDARRLVAQLADCVDAVDRRG